MGNFRGYLFGKVNGSGVVTPFPHKYIDLDAYNCTPNQREEIKAYRDENTRDLTRVTSNGMKSKITFSTRDNLHEKEIKEILDWFTSGEVVAKERKIQLSFWNHESLDYETGYFYRADIQYSVAKITENDIIYKKIDVSLVEY